MNSSDKGKVCESFLNISYLLLFFLFHGFMFSVVNYVFPHYDVTRVTGVNLAETSCHKDRANHQIESS